MLRPSQHRISMHGYQWLCQETVPHKRGDGCILVMSPKSKSVAKAKELSAKIKWEKLNAQWAKVEQGWV